MRASESSTPSAGRSERSRPATSACRRKSMPVAATFIAGSLQVILRPRQAVLGASRGHVLRADPAAIADPVDALEQRREIDLAGARLVPSGNVGELHVAYAGQILLDGRREIVAHDAHVVEVV